MFSIESTSSATGRLGDGSAVDEAQVTAPSFLARYSGRTLDASACFSSPLNATTTNTPPWRCCSA